MVVPLAIALALEAEALVELDRGLVPREDVQLQLTHAGCLRPLDGGSEQRPPDAPAADVLRDHQAEVGHVRARRVRVAGDAEPADDRAVRRALRDEHGRVLVATHRPQVAPLLAGAPPLAV